MHNEQLFPMGRLKCLAQWFMSFLILLILSSCSHASSTISPTTSSPPTTSSTSQTNSPSVQVVRNQLVDASGKQLRLLGVNIQGTESACIRNKGISTSPLTASEAEEMASWGANAVRVPLNEDCWLGINGAPARYSGGAYRAAIIEWVSELNAHGIVAILDLHWSAPGQIRATEEWPMADADHSLQFWSDVASSFVSDKGVVFDLFNEPYLGLGHPSVADWECWQKGCEGSFPVCNSGDHIAGGPTRQCHSVVFRTAGMQQLLDSVRRTGARQPVMIGGLDWASDLCTGRGPASTAEGCLWLKYQPTDPDHQLMASIHNYNFTSCNTLSCWNSNISPLAENVPVVTGELGERDCSASYIDRYMSWADQHGISYLAWAWQSPADAREPCDEQNTDLLGSSPGQANPNSPVAVAFKAHLHASSTGG